MPNYLFVLHIDSVIHSNYNRKFYDLQMIHKKNINKLTRTGNLRALCQIFLKRISEIEAKCFLKMKMKSLLQNWYEIKKSISSIKMMILDRGGGGVHVKNFFPNLTCCKIFKYLSPSSLHSIPQKRLLDDPRILNALKLMIRDVSVPFLTLAYIY